MQNEEKPKQSREKRALHTRRYKIYSLVAAIFLLFLLLASAINLLSRDKNFSESENRVLTQRPVFSLDNLWSGKFMTDTEDYVADQFFGGTAGCA